MTREFAERPSIEASFNYRFLPSMITYVIVSLTRVQPITAFQLLKFLSFFGSCILLSNILHLEIDTEGSLAIDTCVLWFSLLYIGLRFWVGYPILTDPFGIFLLTAALYFTIIDRHWPYIVIMILGRATRENLIIVIVFNVLHGFFKVRVPILKELAYQVPIILAFALVRFAPMLPYEGNCSNIKNVLSSILLIINPVKIFIITTSAINSLVNLLIIPLIYIRSSWNFLKKNFDRLSDSLLGGFLSATEGWDYDRYFLWLFPLALILCCTYIKHCRLSDILTIQLSFLVN